MSSFSGSLGLAQFDPTYSKWAAILSQSVKEGTHGTTIDWQLLASNGQGLKTVSAALSEIESVTSVEYSRFTPDEKKAYLVNAYHMGWFQGLLENFPVKSLKDLNGWFVPFGRKKKIRVHGEQVGLDQIRFDLVRGSFQDPELYFILSQGAQSSVPLLTVPYLGATFPKQMQSQIDRFFKNRNLNWLDREKGVLRLSMVVKWAAKDLDGKGFSVKAYAAKRMTDDPLEKEAILDRKVVLRFNDFNWNL